MLNGREFQTSGAWALKGSCTGTFQVDTRESQKLLRGRTKRLSGGGDNEERRHATQGEGVPSKEPEWKNRQLEDNAFCNRKPVRLFQERCGVIMTGFFNIFFNGKSAWFRIFCSRAVDKENPRRAGRCLAEQSLPTADMRTNKRNRRRLKEKKYTRGQNKNELLFRQDKTAYCVVLPK